MKARVLIKCAGFTLVNEVVETGNTSDALMKAMMRPGVAMHLNDLGRAPVSASAVPVNEDGRDALGTPNRRDACATTGGAAL